MLQEISESLGGLNAEQPRRQDEVSEEDRRRKVHSFWHNFNLFEEETKRYLTDRFKDWFNEQPPQQAVFAWLQSRMGMFTTGNHWIPEDRTNSAAFDTLQKNYRKVFGNESSVNFNLSRAALYRREEGRKLGDGKEQANSIVRRLLIVMLGESEKKKNAAIECENDCVVFSMPKRICDDLLPGGLCEKVKEACSSDQPYVGTALQDELLQSRQKAFLNHVKTGGKTAIERKYSREFVSLSLYLFSLEFLKEPARLEERWKKIRDRFQFKTADEILDHSLSILQAAVFWLRLLVEERGTPKSKVWLFNQLFPLSIERGDFQPTAIREIHQEFFSKVRNTNPELEIKSKLEALSRNHLGSELYNALDFPPDIIALAGVEDMKLGTMESVNSWVQLHLVTNIYLLYLVSEILEDKVLAEEFQWDKMRELFPERDRKAAEDAFALRIDNPGKTYATITTLFPVDATQFKAFIDFCRRHLSAIGTLEGRALRFSLILGSELHKNFYFEERFDSFNEDTDEALNLRDPDGADKARGIIKGNAGLFQNEEFHLFCHTGRRHIDEKAELILSDVVRDSPFGQRMPVGNLFGAEVLADGTIKLLRNRVEICRIVHGDYIFTASWDKKGFTRKIGEFSKDRLKMSADSSSLTAELVTELVENVRQRSHGGTFVICSRENFEIWKGRYITRPTKALKSWENIVVERGQSRLLTELATQDGATFLFPGTNPSSQAKLWASGKWVLYPVDVDVNNGTPTIFDPYNAKWTDGTKIGDFWKANGWETWEKDINKWGTRHLSSLGFSVIVKGEALVITISADGPVSVFHESHLWPKLSLS